MKLPARTLFAGAFMALAGAYVVGFNAAVMTDATAAESRFNELRDGGRPRAAVVYGERVLRMREKAGANIADLSDLRVKLAETSIAARRYARGAALYDTAFADGWGKQSTELERAAAEDHMARAYIAAGEIDRATLIYRDFLAAAGDDAARETPENPDSIESFYAGLTISSARLFSEALKPISNADVISGSVDAKLAAATRMAELGAFHALREEGLYAAAGLLSTAYEIRKADLSPDHPDTVQAALMLGPVYRAMGRLDDAEQLYLDAFHAQEKAKGANSPDLSLYIKLLAGVYEAQGRATEAQALHEHMRNLFRDAFGAQRYASNRVRDRKLDIDRPVSQQFLLPADYAPTDLIAASNYSVPISKNDGIDEMKVRLAADLDEEMGTEEANLPARLAQLMSLCRSETGERLSLRSGYRSYRTQTDLYSRLGHKGTVTPPGMSEHQLGLATDIDVNGRLMRRSDRAFQCFDENAFRFGFILSYPPGNNYLPGDDSFEPWHWRYVGIETAQLYREAGPIDKPQEFLAALPCYRERAVAGGFAAAGEQDVCLVEDGVKVASSAVDEADNSASTTNAVNNAPAARKLNNFSEGGRP